eukprot:1021759-Rhodomonas_salina.2
MSTTTKRHSTTTMSKRSLRTKKEEKTRKSVPWQPSTLAVQHNSEQCSGKLDISQPEGGLVWTMTTLTPPPLPLSLWTMHLTMTTSRQKILTCFTETPSTASKHSAIRAQDSRL